MIQLKSLLRRKYIMQTAEKFATNELEELVEKNTKLERVAELASQLIDASG